MINEIKNLVNTLRDLGHKVLVVSTDGDLVELLKRRELLVDVMKYTRGMPAPRCSAIIAHGLRDKDALEFTYALDSEGSAVFIRIWGRGE